MRCARWLQTRRPAPSTAQAQVLACGGQVGGTPGALLALAAAGPAEAARAAEEARLQRELLLHDARLQARLPRAPHCT